MSHWVSKSMASGYSTDDLDKTNLCDSLPRLQKVKLPLGFCLGLVDSGVTQFSINNTTVGETTIFSPRSIVEVQQNQFILVDQGSKDNMAFAGQIFLIEKKNNQFQRTLLANSKFNPGKFPEEAFIRPSHIAKFKDRIFFSTSRAIFSFQFKNGLISDIKKVISNIQISTDPLVLKAELHPLKNFIFDQNGNLIVNVGSPSNNCTTKIFKNKNEKCQERETRSQLRLYHRLLDDTYNPNFDLIAKGLRNSMALAIHPEQPNWLFQGENSRDAIHKVTANPNLFGDGKTLPHDELNLIDLTKFSETQIPFDFGWPFCYSDNQSSPEYPNVNCTKFNAPFILLPAHAAPLGMIFHTGTNWPQYYKNALLMSLHGYDYSGHRIILSEQKQSGLPSNQIYNFVWNWGIEGNLTLGSPVELFETHDGSVMVTEDNNHTIWRLYFDPKYLNNIAETTPNVSLKVDLERVKPFYKQNKYEELKAQKILNKRLALANPPLFSKIQNLLIDKHCAECHKIKDDSQMLSYNDTVNSDFLVRAKLVIPFQPKNSPFYNLLESEAMPPSGMPAGERARLLKLVEDWINLGAPKPD